jgi:protein-disulfide isomerase
MVARCGGEMRYFGIHDMLFDQQAEWAASQDPVQVVQNLKTIGIAAGLDEAAIDTCLNDQAQAEALIARFQANMAADGVEGTPTIFINGTKHSNMTYADLKAILDAELAG